MHYIEALQNRYAAKKFNTGIKVSSEKIKNILEAGKLSASSLGLQPYRLVVAESHTMLEKLADAFYNTSQISTCSHLVAIIAKIGIEDEYIDSYLSHLSGEREIDVETLAPFRRSIAGYRGRQSADEITAWNEKQGYIVLGNLMFAAALEKVDSCPIEGFMPDKMTEILELNPQEEKVSVTLALGYRADDDHFQHHKKVRKPDEKLFEFL